MLNKQKIATDGQSVANGRESSGGDLSDVIVSSAPASSESPIEILDFTRIDGRGVTKATCRIRCGPFVFAGYRVVLFPLASRPIVQPPARNTGEGWQPYITCLSPTLDDDIATAILTEFRRGAR